MLVIKCMGLAGPLRPGARVPVGQYLQSYDPEFHFGQGDAVWTKDRSKAMQFADFVAAHQCWTQVPKALPVRADGKPNRPLTAFTIEIVDA